MITNRPYLKKTLGALALALAFAVSLPSAEAFRGGGNGGRDGRGDRDNRGGNGGNGGGWGGGLGGGNGGGNDEKPKLTNGPYYNYNNNDDDDDDDDDKDDKKYYTPPSQDSPYAPGLGSSTPSTLQQKLTAKMAGEAQSHYFQKVAKYYRAASSKTLALGIVATAEGLGKMVGQGIKIGDGDTLVANGLKSLQAGNAFKQSEEAALSKVQEAALPKEVDQELIADPLAEEVISDLAQKTGYSKAEVIEKILGSEGSLDSLAQEFEAAAKRKEQISRANQLSDEEMAAAVEDSKSGALRRRINFASLRESLTTSAELAKPAAPQDWKKQWNKMASETQAGMGKAAAPASTKAVAVARAPASQPEFLNLGENLPSFELEQSLTQEAEEASLFEKVHRKYFEIAPSMRRPK